MKHAFDFDRRSSGLLLHLTSLPGPHSGDLGEQAYRFIDFLARAKQTWWQMLPVTPPSEPPGSSPYSSYSALAGSPWLISIERLVEEGLLDRADVTGTLRAQAPGPRRNEIASNFAKSIAYRLPRLRKAFENFRTRRGGHEAFEFFCESQKAWLDDYALFSALMEANRGRSWSRWSADLRLRKPDALRAARTHLAETIAFHQFLQYEFDRQWLALRSYARQRGVGLIGDIPIFVAYDSADVWAHRQLFMLDAAGRPRTQSGYPPDPFNSQGQAWGHPHYDWAAHDATGYAWWIARFAANYRWFDAARIDHFLGFQRAWHIAPGVRNARRGKWVPGPGPRIFQALRAALGKTPIIAEDLGLLTREAAHLRDQFRFPGMRVFQFGFEAGGDYHLPHRYVNRCVAYTGTHDNATIVGWFRQLRKSSTASGSRRAELQKVLRYLDTRSDEIHWVMIRALMASVAQTTIFPAQDLLGLGDEARMNVPGTPEGNWRWRLKPEQLTNEHAYRLAELCDLFDRQSTAPVRPARKRASVPRRAPVSST